MMIRRNSWLLLFPLLLWIALVVGQDLSIYGKFNIYTADIDDQEIDSVYSSCFRGMELVTCSPVLADDDFALDYLLEYYKSLAGVTGQYYCVQCCGTPPNDIDTWDMYCTVSDATNNAVNLFGYELRLARKSYQGDRGIIRCPLRRSACTYDDEGNTISCKQFETFTYLTGYTLTLWVEQYNQNFKYWNGVSKCEIVTQESNFSLVSPEKFRETIVLIHTPLDSAQWDNFKILCVLVFVIFILYGICYFTRSSRCLYCQQKLVFCVRLCYKCRIVGAELPDPDLIKALEEKGERIQGEPPDNVFAPKTIIEFFRERVMGVFCCGFYYLCYCCCFYGGNNRSKSLGRAVSQTIQVKPAGKRNNRVMASTIPDEERGMDNIVELTLKKKQNGIPDVSAAEVETKEATTEGKLVPVAETVAAVPSPPKAGQRKTAPPLDPTIAAKRQWWERSFRKNINPNLIPYQRDIIQVVVRHPTEPDTAENLIQQVRKKKTEEKLVYESVYHPYDPRSVLHRSIMNANEGNGPIQAAATLGKGV